MAEMSALHALTNPNPSERDWIVRGAAELVVRDNMFNWGMSDSVMGKCAAILISAQLATNAVRYLAELGPYGWGRLSADIVICARWALEEKWSF